MEWAKAEVARAERPVLVRVDVPLRKLPVDKIKSIVDLNEILGDSQGVMYKGEEILLLPEIASRYIVGIEPVEPCTCWRDNQICDVCRDYTARPGGWNGTFLER